MSGNQRSHARIPRLSPGAWIDRLLSGPRWKLRALLVVLSLSLFRAFPSYDALRTDFVQAKWRAVQIKFDQPFADTSRLFPPGTHESQLTFRLTAPLLAKTFGLRRNGMLIFFAITGILILYASLHLAHEASKSRRIALFVCLALACVWPGVAAFHELRGGYYDALALCLLLLALSTRRWVVAFLLVFAAAWTDERAVIASFFLLLYPDAGKGGLGGARPQVVSTLLACGAYAGARAYLAVIHSYPAMPAGMGISVLADQLSIIPLAIWTGLGGAWILVVLALPLLLSQRRYLVALGFAGALTATAGGALLVADVTRSMAYCLPAVFVALSVLSRGRPEKQVERLAAIVAGISFIVPTGYVEGPAGVWWLYPLPFQLGRWL